MVKIKNDFLKIQLEEFSKLQTEDEKKAFWEKFNSEVNTIAPTERRQLQEDWKSNMTAVKKRLEEIENTLNHENTIEVFPKSNEERKLIETILKKMNIRFSLK